ncbi:Uncharacterised protein [Acinetobacter junii]|nr:hypothetical protein F948_02663 [Acinetobacter junii CIP 64.5]SUU04965.1 Uncharacterised protein [Acinetobacter junii]SUU07698.1 Uncharacterised protein [Acinetobacter junii]
MSTTWCYTSNDNLSKEKGEVVKIVDLRPWQ